MKNLNFKYAIACLCIMLMAVSCAESDKVVDQITDDVTRGANLRQLQVFSNSVAINSATNELVDGEEFSVLLEYQDNEDGGLLSNMEVFVSFVDNTDDNGENSRGEVLAETVPASAFAGGDRGLPQLMYSISAQAMQSALSLSGSEIGFGGDQFIVRFQINLTDGRSFTDAQNSGTLTGSYFSSPFSNRINVVCSPSKPTSGTWTVATTDTYGDGWNGANLQVVIDGALAETIANIDGNGNEQEFTFQVPDGAQTISIQFTSGPWDCEIIFVVTSANGNEVASFGPNPPAGIELLDYCADNL